MVSLAVAVLEEMVASVSYLSSLSSAAAVEVMAFSKSKPTQIGTSS